MSNTNDLTKNVKSDKESFYCCFKKAYSETNAISSNLIDFGLENSNGFSAFLSTNIENSMEIVMQGFQYLDSEFDKLIYADSAVLQQIKSFCESIHSKCQSIP